MRVRVNATRHHKQVRRVNNLGVVRSSQIFANRRNQAVLAKDIRHKRPVGIDNRAVTNQNSLRSMGGQAVSYGRNLHTRRSGSAPLPAMNLELPSQVLPCSHMYA